jgi:hypothetical protein
MELCFEQEKRKIKLDLRKSAKSVFPLIFIVFNVNK